jgi:hypothetical protein
MKRGPDWVKTKKGWKKRSELGGQLWVYLEFPTYEYERGYISWVRWRWEQLKQLGLELVRLILALPSRYSKLKEEAKFNFWWYRDELMYQTDLFRKNICKLVRK